MTDHGYDDDNTEPPLEEQAAVFRRQARVITGWIAAFRQEE